MLGFITCQVMFKCHPDHRANCELINLIIIMLTEVEKVDEAIKWLCRKLHCLEGRKIGKEKKYKNGG